MKLPPVSFIALIMVLSSPALSGVVTPLNSSRTVTALNRETLPQTQVTLTGPAVGPRQAQAQAINDTGHPNVNPNGSVVYVTSSQLSDFSPDGVSFHGFVFIDYHAAALPQLGTSVSNRCDTVFHVEGSCDYLFQAAYSGEDLFSETSSAIFLRNNATAQTYFSLADSGTRSGTLPTGDYTLSILISGGTSGSQIADARRQIDATFSIPAPPAALALLPAGLLAARRRRAVIG